VESKFLKVDFTAFEKLKALHLDLYDHHSEDAINLIPNLEKVVFDKFDCQDLDVQQIIHKNMSVGEIMKVLSKLRDLLEE
jgi:hypothetical protein